ncbi:hypothetical protein GB937_008847 [Aspergillus fischeri]|nr:hypothetical protein GB937_008847 [Aspergillus fischeri]
MSCQTKLEDCTVVWLCPLEVELRAAIAMLDRVCEDIPLRARGQDVIYTVGEIGPHKVAVVGYYQEQGLAVSGSMVAEVKRDLPNLQFGLLVGVAGGIPSSTRDIQLGDVAVAVPEGDRPGVVGYDLGKAGEDDRFELKHWQSATHPLLRSVINITRARNEFGFWRHLRIVDDLAEFQRPDGRPANPKVHYGTILSGNSVIKSKARRDYLKDRYGGIAVEMEAAGMMSRLPVAVIRGISDFADCDKNDGWQPYAAITAAAYAKELLVRLPGESKENCLSNNVRGSPIPTPFSDKDIRLAQALPEKWAFMGREDEMAFLREELGFSTQPPLQRCVVGLWGLTGIGKSQLAARFVNQQRSKHPEREIFWISGESREAFEHSVISMLRVGGHCHGLETTPDSTTSAKQSQQDRIALVNSFFAELNRAEDARWLLVIDAVNSNPYPNSSDTSSANIHSYVGRLKRGYVLLTSRRRDIVERYHPNRELKGLSDEDAIALLRTQVDPRLVEGEGMRERVGLLKGLPLALRLAASVISRYRYTVKDYLEAWRSRGADGEFLDVDETLSRSMELSFEELEMTDPMAAKILTLFGFLHHRDLWYDLCLGASDDKYYPAWLRELAVQKRQFREFYPLLADLSFIELRCSANGRQLWETHPAIQVVARQRAISNGQEQLYIRCAISLVVSHIPRSYEEGFWETMRRLEPHADLCWSYITQGKWGPGTNLTELESLARLFRHVGRYERAALIYRMIENGVNSLPQIRTVDTNEFLADVLTNLGLVYTAQQKFELALRAFEESLALKRGMGGPTPDESMSIMYNKAVVFMMTERLEEAERLLRDAAAHFAPPETEHILMRKERNHLYIRILKDIGEVLLRKGSVEAAMDLFRNVFDSQRDGLGDFHPTLVSLKLNLGRAHTKLGQFTAARTLLAEVIAIYTEWWGRRHPETMRAIDELAWALMEEGRHKQGDNIPAMSEMRKAGELWEEVLSFYKGIYGDGSDMAGRIKSNLLCLGNIDSGNPEMNGGYVPIPNL